MTGWLALGGRLARTLAEITATAVLCGLQKAAYTLIDRRRPTSAH